MLIGSLANKIPKSMMFAVSILQSVDCFRITRRIKDFKGNRKQLKLCTQQDAKRSTIIRKYETDCIEERHSLFTKKGIN